VLDSVSVLAQPLARQQGEPTLGHQRSLRRSYQVITVSMSDDDDFMNDSEDENAFDSPEDSDGVSTTTPTTSPTHSLTPSSHSLTHSPRSLTHTGTHHQLHARTLYARHTLRIPGPCPPWFSCESRAGTASAREEWVYLACGAWRRNAESVHSFIASQQLAHTCRATTAAALMLTWAKR
jgi:hypothetical protein